MSDLQFGVNVRSVDPDPGLRSYVERVDELGFDILALPDHLGGPSPFATLAAAAQISDRLRLRTYVLNVGFWNPALLAREVATLDALSDGRAELGLGAGHMKSEHDDAGLPWPPFAERVDRMERTLVEVRGRLADERHQPRPVQRPVPVVVGAMSAAGLAVAARHADVVAFAGIRQVRGAPPGTFSPSSSAETADRVRAVREALAGRRATFDCLLQVVSIDRDPRDAAAEISRALPGLTADEVLDCPFLLLAADAAAAAAELRRRHHVFGFDQILTHERNLEALGRVAAAYRAG